MAEELQALVDEDTEIVSGVMKDVADQATLAGRHSLTNRYDSDTSSTALLEVIGVFDYPKSINGHTEFKSPTCKHLHLGELPERMNVQHPQLLSEYST